jgi:hypothetical protein
MDTLREVRYTQERLCRQLNPLPLLPPWGQPPPPPKRYDGAFKRQAVVNWLRSSRPGTQVARELGISYPALKE